MPALWLRRPRASAPGCDAVLNACFRRPTTTKFADPSAMHSPPQLVRTRWHRASHLRQPRQLLRPCAPPPTHPTLPQPVEGAAVRLGPARETPCVRLCRSLPPQSRPAVAAPEIRSFGASHCLARRRSTIGRRASSERRHLQARRSRPTQQSRICPSLQRPWPSSSVHLQSTLRPPLGAQSLFSVRRRPHRRCSHRAPDPHRQHTHLRPSMRPRLWCHRTHRQPQSSSLPPQRRPQSPPLPLPPRARMPSRRQAIRSVAALTVAHRSNRRHHLQAPTRHALKPPSLSSPEHRHIERCRRTHYSARCVQPCNDARRQTRPCRSSLAPLLLPRSGWHGPSANEPTSTRDQRTWSLHGRPSSQLSNDRLIPTRLRVAQPHRRTNASTSPAHRNQAPLRFEGHRRHQPSRSPLLVRCLMVVKYRREHRRARVHLSAPPPQHPMTRQLQRSRPSAAASPKQQHRTRRRTATLNRHPLRLHRAKHLKSQRRRPLETPTNSSLGS